MKETEQPILKSFYYAFSGLAYVLRTQKHMRFHFLAAILVLVLSLFLHLTGVETVILFFSIGLVLITEMVNTSLESMIDLITQEQHPLAKIVKDVAAGCVLVAALNSIVVGLIILLPRLVDLIKIPK